MITIYGIASSQASRCLWMLEELGLPYQRVPIDHRQDEHLREEYSRINPNQHVPTLVDGELVLWESMAINLYLAQRYDGGLKPRSDEALGLAMQWSFWAVTEALQPLQTALRHRHMFPPAQRNAAVAEAAEAAAQKPLRVLEGALAGRTYLLEERFTVADLNLASVLNWTAGGQVDLGPFPRIGQWLDRCRDRPAWRKWRSMAGTFPKRYKAFGNLEGAGPED